MSDTPLPDHCERDHAFLVWVLDRYLVRTGSYWHCPWCERSNASIACSPPDGDRQKLVWKCTQCGKWGDAFVLLAWAHPHEKYPARRVRLDQLREAFEADDTLCVTAGKKEAPPSLCPTRTVGTVGVDPITPPTNPTPGKSFFPRSDTSSAAGRDPDHWLKLAQKYAVCEEETCELVEALGLPDDVVVPLPLLGYDADHHALTMPLSDGRGAVTGLFRRPAAGEPRAYTGAHGTLFIPPEWQEHPGPVLVTEGLSDTVAAVAVGLRVVGRLSSHAGAADLALLFADLAPDARVVVMADDDVPGVEGAIRVADHLAPQLRCQVTWAPPPSGFKDVRAWLTAPERSGTPWADRGRELFTLLGR